jgi:Xaa-Pro dipeptidase
MIKTPDIARRRLFKLSAAGLLAAGVASRADHVAAMQPSLSGALTSQLGQVSARGSSALILPATYGGKDQPVAPTAADQLTREWHQSRFQALFDKVAEQGVEAILLRNVNNTAYFTGIWVFASERPWGAFKNRDDAAPWAFHPTHYTEILKSSWVDGGREYFDFPHAERGFPHRGQAEVGPSVDLFRFMIEGLKEKGVQGNKLGIDGELYPSELARIQAILPGVEVVNISAAIRDLRIVKTPEELALYSRSYLYNDRAQAFARDYLLTYGTDVTDLELETVTQLWISNEIYGDVDLGGGAANHGASTRASVKIRTGRNTGVSAPNQPYFQKFGPDQTTQLTSTVKFNGCGGELYRVFLTARADGQFDPHAERLWNASLSACNTQRDLQKAGVKANALAKVIYDDLIAQDLHRYIYHRPAHGLAFEGHYPPFLTLGDETPLPLNSALSQEPGLYDPERGYGFNWSDTVVTGEDRGVRLSRVPYSREWSLLKL